MRVVVLLLVGMMLAGCTEEAKEQADEVVTESATVDENGTLLPVVASFVTLLDGNITMPENGTLMVPAGVNITFNGTESLGNITSYNWTIGNVTYDNATISHAFEAGNHTVNLTVMDAAGQNATASLNVTATATEVAAPELVSSTPIGFTGSAPVEALECLTATQSLEFPDNTFTPRVTMTMDPGWSGVAFDVAYKLALRDASGTEVASASRSGGSDNLVMDATGLVLAPGSYTAYAEFCTTAAANMSLSVSGQADHHA